MFLRIGRQLRETQTLLVIFYKINNTLNLDSINNSYFPNQENEDALSEYSEASLDGRDISQFLDTQMEEEPMDGSSKFPMKSLIPFPADNCNFFFTFNFFFMQIFNNIHIF